MKADVAGIHRFFSKQPKAVDMAKMGVSQQHILDVGLAPNRQLLSKKARCLNQMIRIGI